MKYYSLKNILSYNATYNVIFGERSNGKTFAVLEYGVSKYVENGAQMAIIRRWGEDFKGKRGSAMFAALCEKGVIKDVTKGIWTDVYYYGSKWYLCRYDDGKRITDETPFCYGFSIAAQEHDKSTNYPRVENILYDEFLSRQRYLDDEFVLLMNLLSTIIRERSNVKIFMLGNTVNQYCPYFAEMGLTHIKQMKQGDIDLYTYGNSELTVAVEYTAPNKQGKASDKYFAFDNPKLNMITGGAWEIDIYPHCPIKYKPKDIKFTYFIEFGRELLQCEIVRQGRYDFTFIHRKTTPIKNPDKDIVFSTEYDPRPNYHRKITKPISKLEKGIARYFQKEKVFYSDNETGEIVRNYLQWC